MAFKAGELVQLKSGGPAMTVENDYGLTTQAVWFDDKGKCTSRVFGVDVLEYVEDQPEPENEEL